MAIPLVDLKKQYHTIKKEIDAAILSVLEGGCFILGEPVARFEKNFAEICGARYGIGTSSGTSALHVALVGLGIGRGDEVITVPNTFIATTEAISQAGAKIVFADVDPRTLTLSPTALRKAITPRTKAVIVVHLYGQCADMDEILSIAAEKGIKVVEDCSQAHLARFKGRCAGTMGDCGCFSFFPGKNLGAYGDGGMVLANDQKLADRIRMLINHGRRQKYEHAFEGFNYRLDTLQAAVLDVKLKYLKSWTDRRREIAGRYSAGLAQSGLVLPVMDSGYEHAHHLYVVRVKDRCALEQALASEAITTGVHYPIPLHLQEAYKHLGYFPGDFPETENSSLEILSLPIFPELTDQEVDRIISIVLRHLSCDPAVKVAHNV